MGCVLEAGTMTTSRIKSVTEAADEKTMRLFANVGFATGMWLTETGRV
jgi:hypothetical protein